MFQLYPLRLHFCRISGWSGEGCIYKGKVDFLEINGRAVSWLIVLDVSMNGRENVRRVNRRDYGDNAGKLSAVIRCVPTVPVRNFSA